MMNNKPGMADYMLEVMRQITDKATLDNEITYAEKEKLGKLNQKTVTEKYMTAREWEMSI